MRQALSTIVAIALLLGLGALAVLALPGAQVALNPVPVAVAAPVAVAPDAVMATEKYNMIAVPLDSSNQMSGFSASGLAALVGAGVQQVFQLDAATQSFQTWYPPFNFGTDFPLTVGGAYWLLLDNTASQIVSFVGDVPPPTGQSGAVQFNLIGGSPCVYNDISLPLDKSSITNASELANAIGGVEEVLKFDAANQSFQVWYPDFNFGTNFDTKIGYPYRICLKSSAPTTWP